MAYWRFDLDSLHKTNSSGNMCVSAWGCVVCVVSRTAAVKDTSGESAWFLGVKKWPNSIDLCWVGRCCMCFLSCPLTSSQCCDLSCQQACMSHLQLTGDDADARLVDELLSSAKQSLSFSFIVYVLSPLRLKGRLSDIPDGAKQKPQLQAENTSSTHASNKQTDTHFTPPNHCEMKASRLPTLPEEETSDLKSPDPVPVVREEADGKDDSVEVNIHSIHKQTNTHNQS